MAPGLLMGEPFIQAAAPYSLHAVLIAMAPSFSCGACREAFGMPLGVTLSSHLVLGFTLGTRGVPLVSRPPQLPEDLHR